MRRVQPQRKLPRQSHRHPSRHPFRFLTSRIVILHDIQSDDIVDAADEIDEKKVITSDEIDVPLKKKNKNNKANTSDDIVGAANVADEKKVMSVDDTFCLLIGSC
ncbi:hypothetical protein KCU78_g603, partial [Aureobasidium melanogenum]